MNIPFRHGVDDDTKIQQIIDSFDKYAFGDIEHNMPDKPIAAFILCSCLIDQLASFSFSPNKNNGNRYTEFVKKYLPSYNSFKLYENLRCLLVHNYSVGEYLSLSSENLNELPNYFNVNHITAKGLFTDLKIAFDQFVIDIKGNTREREYALKRFKKSPPIIESKITAWTYSKEEADFLIERYSPILVGKLINNNESYKIDSLIKIEVTKAIDPFRVLCVSPKGIMNFYSDLEMVTHQFGLPYPVNLLKEAGLYKEHTPSPSHNEGL